MKKHHIQLTDAHRSFLEDLLRKGDLPVKTYRRALALLELDRGKTYTAVAPHAPGNQFHLEYLGDQIYRRRAPDVSGPGPDRASGGYRWRATGEGHRVGL